MNSLCQKYVGRNLKNICFEIESEVKKAELLKVDSNEK
jgi:hypothetical protein